MKKITSAILLTVILCLALTSCSDGAVIQDKIPIERVELSDDYNESNKSTLANRLYEAFKSAAAEALGSFSEDSALRSSCHSLIEALESLDISLSEGVRTIGAITDNAEQIKALLEPIGSGEGMPMDELAPTYSLLTPALGSDKAARLIYEGLIIYSDYMHQRYLRLYSSNPMYTYLYDEALMWESYSASFTHIGRDNFSAFLKLAISTLSLSDESIENPDIITNIFTPKELVIFIKSQAELMRNIKIDSVGYKFLIEFFGNECGIPFAKDIVAGDKTDFYAEKLPTLVPFMADVMSRASVSRLYMSGDVSYKSIAYSSIFLMNSEELEFFLTFVPEADAENLRNSYQGMLEDENLRTKIKHSLIFITIFSNFSYLT